MMAQNTFNPDNYLTITALEDDLQVSFSNSIEYSLNGIKWNILNPKEVTPYYNQGTKIYFKRFCEPYSGSVGTFSVTKKFALSGNSLSIIFGDNAEGKVDLNGCLFQYLFNNVTTLLSISENFLPATVLNKNCYMYMFYGCTGLTELPEGLLKADVLKSYCYNHMFHNCSNLINIPKKLLQGTILSDGCYANMFHSCKKIVEAPELPSTKVYSSSYISMFYNCTSLVTAPELPATVLGGLCYQSMFNKCSNLNSKIVLPAITLQDQSYVMTFNNCKQINNITLLTTDAPTKTKMRDCFKGVASEGIIILNKNITWNPEDYRNGNIDNVEGSVTLGETITWGIPAGWEVKYCDPDNIDDVRDYREIDQPW